MNCPGFQDVEGGGCVHLDGLHAVADAVLHEREAEEVAIVRVYDVRSLMGWSPAFPAATPSPRARSRPLVHPARYLEDLIPVGLHELDGHAPGNISCFSGELLWTSSEKCHSSLRYSLYCCDGVTEVAW